MMKEQAERRLDKNEGHDTEAHAGKALTQTGFVRKCKRCRILMAYHPVKQ